MTTPNEFYVGQADRSPNVGPACLPASQAGRYAADLAKASGKPVHVYAGRNGGEPLAKVAVDGSLAALATDDEIAKLSAAEYRAAADANGRAWLPIGEHSAEHLRALAKSLEAAPPTPHEANASALGKWLLRAVGG